MVLIYHNPDNTNHDEHAVTFQLPTLVLSLSNKIKANNVKLETAECNDKIIFSMIFVTNTTKSKSASLNSEEADVKLRR